MGVIYYLNSWFVPTDLGIIFLEVNKIVIHENHINKGKRKNEREKILFDLLDHKHNQQKVLHWQA